MTGCKREEFDGDNENWGQQSNECPKGEGKMSQYMRSFNNFIDSVLNTCHVLNNR